MDADPQQPESVQRPQPAVGGTSAAALQQAAPKFGTWRARIIAYLSESPATLFEIALHYGVADHIISGRFTDLCAGGYIEPSGERRLKPGTNCYCEVYRLRRDGPNGLDDVGQEVEQFLDRVYPNTLTIDGQLYDRQTLLPGEGYPAMPYARRADSGGTRVIVRIEVSECPGCGKPLFLSGPPAAGQKPDFACGNPRCGRVWKCRAINEPGKSAMLVLVMEKIS